MIERPSPGFFAVMTPVETSRQEIPGRGGNEQERERGLGREGECMREHSIS